MCIAIPKKVIKVDNTSFTAIIIDNDEEIKIDIALLDKIKVGDYIVIQSGVAIQSMSEIEANEIFKVWNSAVDSTNDS